MKRRIKKWYLAVVFLLTVWFLSVYCVFSLPDVSYLRNTNPSTTAFIESTGRRMHLKWVSFDSIPWHLKKAVVMAEDSTFFRHRGFDVGEIKKAVVENLKKRRFARGASTITQQLARNLYLSPEKTPWRKLREFLIALKLERELSKERILEIYLNVIQWGRGIYGVGNAAQYYFGVDVSRLTKEQSAFLAAIIPNPEKFGSKPSRVRRKVRYILSNLK